MTKHYLTWWNIENLFDTCNSSHRPDWLAKTLKKELKNWDDKILDKKLTNISSIICKINNCKGPDIIGVCEVENRNVLEKLIKKLSCLQRNYKIIHHNTDDKRGIDVAFIYDAAKYTHKGKIFSLEIMKRNATRDILQIELFTKKGNKLTILGNHWPSRSGGQYKTEPYRIMAAETLSYWISRVQEISGDKTPIIVMGDFNDEPFSRSLTDYALSCENRNKVSYGKNPYLFNLCYETVGQRKGSFIFNSTPFMFDQILVSKGLAQKSNVFQLDTKAFCIETFNGMTKGRYNTPVRFGRPSNKNIFNPAGFSDHLPVSVIINEK